MERVWQLSENNCAQERKKVKSAEVRCIWWKRSSCDNAVHPRSRGVASVQLWPLSRLTQAKSYITAAPLSVSVSLGQWWGRRNTHSLTLTLPNSQARSRGVFLVLLIRQGLDWCCSSISDWEKQTDRESTHTHTQRQDQIPYTHCHRGH